MNTRYTLQAIADYLHVELRGNANCEIKGINTLQAAKTGDLAFLANPAYKRFLKTTEASAVILGKEDAAEFSGNALISKNPYLSYARLSRLFDHYYEFSSGIAETALIDKLAAVSNSAAVGPGAIIDSGAVVGSNTYIGAGTYVGRDTVIGDNCYLHPNVTVSHGVAVGSCVIIHSGAVIGADGFGFANEAGHWVKIYQLGGVIIGDNVEIGAGTTIDRGALGNTIIGDGVIIDNLVQIAHNVEVGDNSALAGCSAIAGSSRIGKNCVLAGGAGLVGHISLCDNVTVTARSMITKSIMEPGIYSSGTPFYDSQKWKKNAIRIGQLDSIAKRLSALEKRNKE